MELRDALVAPRVRGAAVDAHERHARGEQALLEPS